MLFVALATLFTAATPVGPATETPLRLVLATDPPVAAEQPAGTFDFDLLPEKTRTPADLQAAEELTRSLLVRRRVLKHHQAFGIATVALLAATVVVGQLSFSDKFGGANTGKFEVTHDLLEAGATLSFATTGLLALFAPVPIPKKNTATMVVHKVSMLTASAGFVAEIFLGAITVSLEGTRANFPWARRI